MSQSIAMRAQSIVSTRLDDLVGAMDGAAAERIVREAIREIECASRETRSEAALVDVAISRARRRIEGTRSKAAEVSASAVSALEMYRDDRAEAAIVRQLHLEQQLPVLARLHAALDERQAGLAALLATLEGRRSEIEADLSAYLQARDSLSADAMRPAAR